MVGGNASKNKKKKVIIKKKKWKNQAKLNASAEHFNFKKFVYVQSFPALCQSFVPHTRKLFWNSSLNESERKNVVLITIQLSEVKTQQGSELLQVKCLVYLFTSLISKELSLISIRNTAYITLNLGRYFLNNRVSTFLEERNICTFSSYNMGMKNWNQ